MEYIEKKEKKDSQKPKNHPRQPSNGECAVTPIEIRTVPGWTNPGTKQLPIQSQPKLELPLQI